ncbi:hypothetical protein ScalyP_jg3887 [Parmales sp. scaly parma]|nr:hypothetical protein ScalyP_jg3887 [Parmales sp. scaly parma]
MVRACHLLCKHTGSRNPISRRTNKQIIATPEEAMEELSQILDEICKADDPAAAFVKRAGERSDCGSYANNGDLGEFERGQMQKSFEDATFALKLGEISQIVSGDSGYHIIMRTG